MKYFFVDESGDFTSKDKKEEYFVMVVVSTMDKKGLENVMRRTRKTILSKKEQSRTSEVKGSRSTTRFKKYFFNKLSDFKDFEVTIIYVSKKKIKQLNAKQAAIYLRALKQLLIKSGLKEIGGFHLIIDEKPLSGMKTQALETALIEEFALVGTRPKAMFVNFDSTPNVVGLHVADFIAWAVYQKYQKGDETWYKTFKKNIKKEFEFIIK